METPIQDGGDDLDESGPIIEDITELCDFCVKLTEAMVTIPGRGDGCLNSKMVIEYTGSSMQGRGLRTCGFCELILESLRECGHMRANLTATDWKQEKDGFCRKNSGAQRLSPDWSPYQIRGISICESEFSIWADQGDSTKRASFVVPLLTTISRQSSMYHPDRSATGAWPAHRSSLQTHSALAARLSQSQIL